MQNTDNDAHESSSNSDDDRGTGGTNSESPVSLSSRQDTTTQSSRYGDVQTINPSNTIMMSSGCDAVQSNNPFVLEPYSIHIPTSMELDMNNGGSMAADMPFSMEGDDFMDSITEQPATTNGNTCLYHQEVDRRFPIPTEPQAHDGPYFDSETDPQSMLLDMDYLHSQQAMLVITIENPSPDVINGIMGVLVPSKTKFKMEMQ